MSCRRLLFTLAALLTSTSVAFSITPAYARDSGANAGQAGPSPEATSNRLPGVLERKVHRLRAELESQGYEILRGNFKLFTIADCKYVVKVIGHCMGNNPAAPYIFPTVPLWKDEYADTRVKTMFGPLPDNNWGAYRLGKREAMVIVGILPPPARYLGIQTYIWSRPVAVNPNDPIYQKSKSEPVWHRILFAKAADPSRLALFASMGNSNNNVVIQRQSGKAFSAQRAFVITPDENMAGKMADALDRAGVATRDQTFTEPVPAAIAHLGYSARADDFMTILRYSQPTDKAAGDRWRHHITLAVLRVRPRASAGAAKPFPTPVYRKKGGHSEQALKSDLGHLVTAVKREWGQPDAPVAHSQSLQLALDLFGQHCLKRPMGCLGDTQDTDYQASDTVRLDPNRVIAVVGTLGTATRNATYVGLSVNRLDTLTGLANISDADLKGSASRYSGTVHNTDKLYVQYFARNCQGLPHCQAISYKLIPKGGTMKLIQRDYIVPGTESGPDPRLLVNPEFIVFNARGRPAAGNGGGEENR